MRLILLGLFFSSLVSSTGHSPYRQIVNTDIGLELSGRPGLIEASNDLVRFFARQIAGPKSSLQMRIGAEGQPAKQDQLWGELDATKLYGHWIKDGGFLKHRNVIYRLGLEKLKKVRLRIGSGANVEPELDVVGIGKSQIPQLLSYLSKEDVWQPSLKAGEAFTNIAIKPDRMWLLLERVGNGLYPLEIALLKTNLGVIQKELKQSLLDDALGSDAQVLSLWHELKTQRPQWALKLDLKNGHIAKEILTPFLALMPGLIPGLAVQDKDVGGMKLLVIQKGINAKQKTFALFRQESIILSNSVEKIKKMLQSSPHRQGGRATKYAARGVFRPARNVGKILRQGRQEVWSLSILEDHLQVDLH